MEGLNELFEFICSHEGITETEKVKTMKSCLGYNLIKWEKCEKLYSTTIERCFSTVFNLEFMKHLTSILMCHKGLEETHDKMFNCTLRTVRDQIVKSEYLAGRISKYGERWYGCSDMVDVIGYVEVEETQHYLTNDYDMYCVIKFVCRAIIMAAFKHMDPSNMWITDKGYEIKIASGKTNGSINSDKDLIMLQKIANNFGYLNVSLKGIVFGFTPL